MKLKELFDTAINVRIDVYKDDTIDGVIKLIGSKKVGDDVTIFDSYADWEVHVIVPGVYGKYDVPYLNVVLTSYKSSDEAITATNEKKTLYKIVKEDLGESFMDGILFTNMDVARRYVNYLDSMVQLYDLNELWFGRKYQFEIVEVQIQYVTKDGCKMYKVAFYRTKGIYQNNNIVNCFECRQKLRVVRFEKEFDTLNQLANYMVGSKHLITSAESLSVQERNILEQKTKTLTDGKLIQHRPGQFRWFD